MKHKKRKKKNNNRPVFVKILKAKDVEQAYCLLRVVRLLTLGVNNCVDFVNDPNEKSPIYCLQVKRGKAVRRQKYDTQ